MTQSQQIVDEVIQSGLFDGEYYRKETGLAFSEIGLAVKHYLDVGCTLGYSPGPLFDTSHYLESYPDVRISGVNPLLHFIRNGRRENRVPLPSSRRHILSGSVPKPRAPSQDDWDDLIENFTAPTKKPKVDVIVPVYKGFDETLRCLYSAISSRQKTTYKVVVVDDHGPDPELRKVLTTLASSGLIELHSTPRNMGFVGACNLAMRLHRDRDVLLLNSDTEVHNDWLDRMRAAAYADRRIATVTPFSNNAEICSYPRFVRDNWQHLEIDDASLDSIASEVNAGRYIDIPTGVGFCMYIRRACINQIGFFDENEFGRGYGEENDLCRRAAKLGWRNILACDVFVRHYGATSFGSSKQELIISASKTINRLHPEYFKLVDDFIREDTPWRFRRNIDLGRLAKRAAGKKVFLFVTHSWGGGTERHVRDLAALLEKSGSAVFFCRPDKENENLIVLNHPAIEDTPNILPINLVRDLSEFSDILSCLRIDIVHIHHTAGMSSIAPDFFRRACQIAGVRYDVTVHDYMSVCPRITLIDGSGLYCGEPKISVCENCIESNGSPFGTPSVWEWRDRFARLLSDARKVYVPNRDVKVRMNRYFPNISFSVREHPENITLGLNDTELSSDQKTAVAKLPPRSVRRVVLIGALGPHKGSQLLYDCAAASISQSLPIEYVVVGYTDRDDMFSGLINVYILGRYEEYDLPALLKIVDADVAFFPSVLPETYSYTLSAAFRAELFPVAFDFGAIADRIRRSNFGQLLPIQAMLDASSLARTLATIEIVAPSGPIDQSTLLYADPIQSYYDLQ